MKIIGIQGTFSISTLNSWTTYQSLPQQYRLKIKPPSASQTKILPVCLGRVKVTADVVLFFSSSFSSLIFVSADICRERRVDLVTERRHDSKLVMNDESFNIHDWIIWLSESLDTYMIEKGHANTRERVQHFALLAAKNENIASEIWQ